MTGIRKFSVLQDATAYALLLHQLAPESCSLDPLHIEDHFERAKAVLAQAERINCRKYITPKDLVEGSANLNLAFVAHLFHTKCVSITTTIICIQWCCNYTKREWLLFGMFFYNSGVFFIVQIIVHCCSDNILLLIIPGMDWHKTLQSMIMLNCLKMMSTRKPQERSVCTGRGSTVRALKLLLPHFLRMCVMGMFFLSMMLTCWSLDKARKYHLSSLTVLWLI
jgi:hypothetical protein